VNTARFTIEHHPDTDQCGNDMITHGIWIDPINVIAPEWVLEAASQRLCADPRHADKHLTPRVDHVIDAMKRNSLRSVVIITLDRRHLMNALDFGPIDRYIDEAAMAPHRGGAKHALLYLPTEEYALVSVERARDAS